MPQPFESSIDQAILALLSIGYALFGWAVVRVNRDLNTKAESKE